MKVGQAYRLSVIVEASSNTRTNRLSEEGGGLALESDVDVVPAGHSGGRAAQELLDHELDALSKSSVAVEWRRW